MFKKMIVLMLALSMFTVQANATTTSGLKAAFDELNYSLTVDWDQKDESFKNAKIREFSASITALQEKGLTNAELIEFVKTQVKDAKVARDVETAFNMIQINKMSQSDATAYMMETMKKSYSTGANYMGTLEYALAVAIVVGVVIAVVIASDCGPGRRNVCTTYCDYWSCWDECYCSRY